MATTVALIVSPICRVHLQWVPFRCGVNGNEDTDTVAKEAAEFPQARVPMDDRIRPPMLRGRQSDQWPWATAPHSALNVHQFHAGHWSGSGHNNISAESGRIPPRNASRLLRQLPFCGPVYRVSWGGRHQTSCHSSVSAQQQHNNTAYREGCHSTRPSAAARGPGT